MFFFLLGMGLLLHRYSISNGDMAYYVARVMEWEGKKVDVSNLQNILAGELDASEMHVQDESLQKGGLELMDYYRIKPLYSFASFLLTKLGLGYVSSLRAVALLGYMATVMLVFYWLLGAHAEWVALVVSMLLGISLPLMHTGAMCTPDSWSAFFILLLFRGIYGRWHPAWLAVIAIAAIFTRLDNALTLMILIWGMRWVNGGRLSWIIMGSGVLVMITTLANWMLTKDPYWFTSISYLQNRGEYQWFQTDFLKVFANSFHMVFLVLLVFLSMSRYWKTNRRELVLSFTGYVVIGVRFLVFPSNQDRFFVPFYLVSAIMVMQMIRDKKIAGQ